MNKIRIFPNKLQGEVLVPSSKSMAHRELICAGLAEGSSTIDNITMSEDIEATIRGLRALGVVIEEIPSKFAGRVALQVTGKGKLRAVATEADCGESGSTLRFLIPLAAGLGAPFTFKGHGKLVGRPLQAYYDIFDEQKLSYTNNEGQLPLTVNGKLRPGEYTLPGNVSSQYVSGLLFALPLLEGDSGLKITSPLESAAYVDMTLACLQKYGVSIDNVKGEHREYIIKGNQKYKSQQSVVEGDWSQAAFWLVGGALGKQINCRGVNFQSLQGDMSIVDTMQRMGAKITTAVTSAIASYGLTNGMVIDGANCPDIVPVLTVLAAVSSGQTKIINIGRLRIKECDRLQAISTELNKLGAEIVEGPTELVIKGKPEGLLGGAQVNAWNDHRIAMSLAIAASVCKNAIILEGADSVKKSYPDFWKDYVALGGRIEVLE